MAGQPDDSMRWELTRDQRFQTACFALCFLAFMLAEAAVNTRAAALLGPQRVTIAYALGLVCTGRHQRVFRLARRAAGGYRRWMVDAERSRLDQQYYCEWQ